MVHLLMQYQILPLDFPTAEYQSCFCSLDCYGGLPVKGGLCLSIVPFSTDLYRVKRFDEI